LFITIIFIYICINVKFKTMKTRLKTNKEKTSFELVVIDKGQCEIHYFDNLQKAINYQNEITK